MKRLIIANWKMHLDLAEAYNILAKLPQQFTNDLIISPPVPFLADLQKNFSHINFCAQDISIYNRLGSYSGEFSAEIIKSCGVNYALIGHSERRLIGRDTNKNVQQKILNCIKSGISPILCVGEPIESRQSKNYPDFILEQINTALPPQDFIKSHPLPSNGIIIAYEPLWAIGAGFTPEISEIHEIIDLIGNSEAVNDLAKSVKIVYGGSVSIENYKKILAIKELDGLIVGSNSVNANDVISMLNHNAAIDSEI